MALCLIWLLHLKLELPVEFNSKIGNLIDLLTKLSCLLDGWTLSLDLSQLEDSLAFSFGDPKAIEHDTLKMLVGLDDRVVLIPLPMMRFGNSSSSYLVKGFRGHASG